MTIHELAEQYKEQADILRKKMNSCKNPFIDDAEYAKYLQYKEMYEDVIYSYRELMKYINA